MALNLRMPWHRTQPSPSPADVPHTEPPAPALTSETLPPPSPEPPPSAEPQPSPEPPPPPIATPKPAMAPLGEGVKSRSAYNALQASAELIKRRVRPAVLVISNCQTFGIANSMKAYTDEFEFDGMPISEIGGKTDEFYLDRLSKYHHIFTIPQLSRLGQLPEFKSKITTIPPVYFHGYHPDAVMLAENGRMINGPIGGYQSCIAYAAYCAGFSEEQTLSFFNAEFYERAGYFEDWHISKAAFFEQFRLLGFSAETHFYRWCAQGTFMHTVNHPKIRVLTSLAHDMLHKMGYTVQNEPEEIVDSLGSGAVFPVYPEIAARTGARGSYRFKPHALVETLTLRDFIELSFELYRNSDPEIVSIHPVYRPRFEAVAALLRGQ